MRALFSCLLALALLAALAACGLCWGEVSTCLSGFGEAPDAFPDAVPDLVLTSVGLACAAALARPR
jgi:hypothetical protein